MQQKFRFLSLKRFFMVVASLLVISCIHAYEWRFQDGKGAVTVKEYSKGKLNGTIHFNPQSNWGREDFRGWFLTLQDGADVQIPHHESLNYKDGFHAQMKAMRA